MEACEAHKIKNICKQRLNLNKNEAMTNFFPFTHGMSVEKRREFERRQENAELKAFLKDEKDHID